MKNTMIKPNILRKRLLALVVCILLSFFIVGCGNSATENDNTEKTDVSSVLEDESSIQGTITEGEIVSPSVETPYGTLYYSTTWEDQIVVEQEAGDVHKITFKGKVEGKGEQPLFTFYFGGDDGELIGYFETEEVDIPIGLIIEEFEPGADWSQEDINAIYSMQEEMNVVIDSLSKIDNFSAE